MVNEYEYEWRIYRTYDFLCFANVHTDVSSYDTMFTLMRILKNKRRRTLHCSTDLFLSQIESSISVFSGWFFENLIFQMWSLCHTDRQSEARRKEALQWLNLSETLWLLSYYCAIQVRSSNNVVCTCMNENYYTMPLVVIIHLGLCHI